VSKRFDHLQERLLQAGIAPRHVRSYLVELNEHFNDLVEAQLAIGQDLEEATVRARTLIGDDEKLTQAMLATPGLRSLTARAPWLIFGILPPLMLILGILMVLMVLMAIGIAGGFLVPHHSLINAPAWFRQAATASDFVFNFVVGPLLAWALAGTADRQRLNPAWPLLAITIITAFGLHLTIGFNKPHQIELGLTSLLPFIPLGGAHRPLFLSQTVLIVLPGLWLLMQQKARRSDTTCRS
jgi:hypothetical protein